MSPRKAIKAPRMSKQREVQLMGQIQCAHEKNREIEDEETAATLARSANNVITLEKDKEKLLDVLSRERQYHLLRAQELVEELRRHGIVPLGY